MLDKGFQRAQKFADQLLQHDDEFMAKRREFFGQCLRRNRKRQKVIEFLKKENRIHLTTNQRGRRKARGDDQKSILRQKIKEVDFRIPVEHLDGDSQLSEGQEHHLRVAQPKAINLDQLMKIKYTISNVQQMDEA